MQNFRALGTPPPDPKISPRNCEFLAKCLLLWMFFQRDGITFFPLFNSHIHKKAALSACAELHIYFDLARFIVIV